MPAALKTKTGIFFLLLLLIGAFFRLYNLNWGAPFYFHPDERNIATAVSQLRFPDQLNPHFFAYGSLPIYLYFITGLLINVFSICKGSLNGCAVDFSQAIIISRIYAAIFSVLLIWLMYKLGDLLHGKSTGLFVAALTSMSVGFIQFAHFGTFEMFITFFITLLFYVLIRLQQQFSLTIVLVMGVILGVLIATKISNLVLITLSFLSFLLVFFKKRSDHLSFAKVIFFIRNYCIVLLLAGLVFLVTNPFILIDYSSFINSMHYESGVGLGTIPVFYTGEFYRTYPIIFQFTEIYPFLINPVLTIIFIPAFVYLSILAFKEKRANILLLLGFYLVIFLSQAFLFVKWTRYMVPTLPFLYLIISISILKLSSLLQRKVFFVLQGILLFGSFIFAASYFVTVFIQPDTRVKAADWTAANVSPSSQILTEVYDLGTMPFTQRIQSITHFNFYDLDIDTNSRQSFQSMLQTHDYILIPSQRIVKPRLKNPSMFHQSSSFYKLLLTEASRYQKVYETPCDIFCQITYLGDPLFHFEQTANVFDRPTVQLFKKVQ